MKKTTTTDMVRDYASRYYIEPARAKGSAVVEIVSGDVHKALRLKSRHQLVCQALASPKFQQDNQVELVEKKAPPTAPSGFSSTIKFVFQLGKRPGNAQVLKDQNDFLSLRGIAKDLFQSVGGGEAFLKKERVAFKDVSDRLEPARQGK